MVAMKLIRLDPIGILWLLLISSISFNGSAATHKLTSNSKIPSHGRSSQPRWKVVKPIDEGTGKPVTSHQLVEALLPRVERLFDIKSKRGKRQVLTEELNNQNEFHAFWPKVYNEESQAMLNWLVKKVRSIDNFHSSPGAPREPISNGLDYLNAMLMRYIKVTQLKPKTKNFPVQQTGSKNDEVAKVPFEGISDLLKSPELEELTLYEAYMELVMLVAILDSFCNEHNAEFKRFKIQLSKSETKSEMINSDNLGDFQLIGIAALPNKVIKDIESFGFADAYKRMAALLVSLDKYLMNETSLTPSQSDSLRKNNELSNSQDSKNLIKETSQIPASDVISQIESKDNRNSKSNTHPVDVTKVEDKNVPQPVSTFTDMSFGNEDDEIKDSIKEPENSNKKLNKDTRTDSKGHSESSVSGPSAQSGMTSGTRLRPMPKYQGEPVQGQESTIHTDNNDRFNLYNPVQVSTVKDYTEELEPNAGKDQTKELEPKDNKDQTKETKVTNEGTQTETVEDDENVTSKESKTYDGNNNLMKIKVLKKYEKEPYIPYEEENPGDPKDPNPNQEIDDPLTVVKDKLINITVNKPTKKQIQTHSKNIPIQINSTHRKESNHLTDLPDQLQVDKIESIGDKNQTSNVTSPNHEINNPNDDDISLTKLEDVDSNKSNQTTTGTKSNSTVNHSDYDEVPRKELSEVIELPKTDQTDQYRNVTTNPNHTNTTSGNPEPVNKDKPSKDNKPQNNDDDSNPDKDEIKTDSDRKDTSGGKQMEREIDEDPSPPGKTMWDIIRESNPSGGDDTIADAIITELFELGVELAFEYYVGRALKGLKYVKKAYDIIKKFNKNPNITKADKKRLFKRFKKIVTESKSKKSIQRKLEKEFGNKAKSKKKNNNKNQKPDLDEDDLPDIDIDEIMQYFEDEERKLDEDQEDSDTDNIGLLEKVDTSDEEVNVDQELTTDDKVSTTKQPESDPIEIKENDKPSSTRDTPTPSRPAPSNPLPPPLPIDLHCPSLPPLNPDLLPSISTSLGRAYPLPPHNWPILSMALLRTKLTPLIWHDHHDPTKMEVGGIALLNPTNPNNPKELTVGVIEKVGRDDVCLSWYSQMLGRLEVVRVAKTRVELVLQ